MFSYFAWLGQGLKLFNLMWSMNFGTGVAAYGNNLSLSLDSHTVPEIWKKSVIVPVPKKTCPSENNDYRPVAITSNVVKSLGDSPRRGRASFRSISICVCKESQYVRRDLHSSTLHSETPGE